MTQEEYEAQLYWETRPIGEPLRIVKELFGENYIGEDAARFSQAYHHIRRMLVHPSAHEVEAERRIKQQLGEIGWQMITIHLVNKSRFHKMTDKPPGQFPSYCNIYGLAPIEPLDPRPDIVFHATETRLVESIRTEGLKPCGPEEDYADTEGLIYVCGKLDGDRESAARWAKLLSGRKGLRASGYSILEFNLRNLSAGRFYQDLHSVSGIVIDQLDCLPPNTIIQVYRYSDGAWVQSFADSTV